MEVLISSNTVINQKLKIYSIFCQYYSDQILEEDTFPLVLEILNDCVYENPSVNEALILLKNSSIQEIQLARYDFNRLFIGPDKLLAPPYESVYRAKDRVLMQQDTAIIRNFYKEAGLEVQNKYSEPDDHIMFELEFICYLLHQVLTSSSVEDKKRFLELYKVFMKTRFIPWVDEHCKDVILHGQSDICVGFAKLLQGVIGEERHSLIEVEGFR